MTRQDKTNVSLKVKISDIVKNVEVEDFMAYPLLGIKFLYF